MGRSSGGCSPRRAFKRHGGCIGVYMAGHRAPNGEFWGRTSPFRSPLGGGSFWAAPRPPPLPDLPLHAPESGSCGLSAGDVGRDFPQRPHQLFLEKPCDGWTGLRFLKVFADLLLGIGCRPTRPTHFDGDAGREDREAGRGGRRPRAGGGEAPKRRCFLSAPALYGLGEKLSTGPPTPKLTVPVQILRFFLDSRFRGRNSLNRNSESGRKVSVGAESRELWGSLR